jgi:N-acetylglutamate synthase-like GNAT family acetyltransferase
MSIEVRRATAEDAEAVREIVLRALREVNARDYPASVIDRLAAILPERIAATLGQTQAYVATDAGRVVGTARLNGRTITSVFVNPADTGRGVGAKLLDVIESAAREKSQTTLDLLSSVTACEFYKKRGFAVVREDFFGEEKVILMMKRLPATSD